MVDYAGRKILVTGGTGFIGGRLAERLAVEEQANVRVLVRDWRKAVWISRVAVELVQGDIRNREDVAAVIAGCELVFHCVGVGGSLDDCMNINVEGTRNVLECAAKAGVSRVVYLSTSAVHGPNPPDNADEQDELRLTGSAYGDSKIFAEKLVAQFCHDRGLPVVIVRPTFVWGPRSPAFTLWPIECMKNGRWFLVDGGRGTCHALYIDNLVDALLLAGVKAEAIAETFLVTDGQLANWASFFGHYARMVGTRDLPSIKSSTGRFMLLMIGYLDSLLSKLNSTPALEPGRTFVRALRRGLSISRRLPKRYVGSIDSWDLIKYARQGELNITRARTLLGYTPRFTLEEGMRETEIWLRDQRII
jgi:nucleoside-diphosphate-sugar epimerase